MPSAVRAVPTYRAGQSTCCDWVRSTNSNVHAGRRVATSTCFIVAIAIVPLYVSCRWSIVIRTHYRRRIINYSRRLHYRLLDTNDRLGNSNYGAFNLNDRFNANSGYFWFFPNNFTCPFNRLRYRCLFVCNCRSIITMLVISILNRARRKNNCR